RNEQRRETRRRSRKRREKRPREHDARQGDPRAEPVAEPPAGQLEQRVRQPKRAEHDAELARAESEVARDVLLRPHDADAIEVREKSEHAEKRHHPMTNASRSVGGAQAVEEYRRNAFQSHPVSATMESRHERSIRRNP